MYINLIQANVMTHDHYTTYTIPICCMCEWFVVNKETTNKQIIFWFKINAAIQLFIGRLPWFTFSKIILMANLIKIAQYLWKLEFERGMYTYIHSLGLMPLLAFLSRDYSYLGFLYKWSIYTYPSLCPCKPYQCFSYFC